MSLSINDILLSPVAATVTAAAFSAMGAILIQITRTLRRLTTLEDGHKANVKVIHRIDRRFTYLLTHYTINHADYREPIEMSELDGK